MARGEMMVQKVSSGRGTVVSRLHGDGGRQAVAQREWWGGRGTHHRRLLRQLLSSAGRDAACPPSEVHLLALRLALIRDRILPLLLPQEIT